MLCYKLQNFGGTRFGFENNGLHLSVTMSKNYLTHIPVFFLSCF